MLFYNCSVFIYSTVAGRKCEINLVVIVIVSTVIGCINHITCSLLIKVKLYTAIAKLQRSVHNDNTTGKSIKISLFQVMTTVS